LVDQLLEVDKNVLPDVTLTFLEGGCNKNVS